VSAFDSVFSLIDQVRGAVQTEMRLQKRQARQALLRAIAELVAVLAIILLTIRYFRRNLFAPLQHLTGAIARLQRGEPGPALAAETKRSDEIGQLAAGVRLLEAAMAEERQLRQRMERLAVTDELTGLHNRHYLDEEVSAMLSRAARYGEQVSLVIFDLDHFTAVNDRQGHPAGDLVLKRTAALVGKAVRTADLLIRWGGEEFLLLMPHTAEEGAATTAEKIRESLERSDHPGVGRVTGSFGVAERRPGESFADWYARTDAALYRAKQAGRNRVERG
jgi:diguanylate cyclase (GGDEF)-like protein